MRNRLSQLRQIMVQQNLAAFIIPHADEHQSESTPAYAERLAWITGFTGSAGLAAIGLDRAVLFTDSRYTLQALEQVGEDFEHLKLYEDKLEGWLLLHVKVGDRIGYDPWLVTSLWTEEMTVALAKIGAQLAPLDQNPIDMIWQDRPAASQQPIIIHPLQYSGQSHHDKCRSIGEQIKELGADAFVLTSLVSICWLLNIRGRDVANTPLVLSYAILNSDGSVQLFTDPRKLTPEVKKHLGSTVEYFPKDSFSDALQKRGDQKIILDDKITPAAVFNILKQSGAEIITEDDPTELPRACKNETEINGTKAAHIRDAAALCKFYRWIDENAALGSVTEISAVQKLFSFREQGEFFQMNSFDTISGAGANGAVVHYRVSESSSQPLKKDMIYLCDSGGQYLDGTTDITRTVVIGSSTAEQKDRFTRVLKGHIALACVHFPKGRSGAHLDSLARTPLWEISQDFDHGTGHGVGSYLSVHEGPQSISAACHNVPLEIGMTLSNEPGFYKTDEYGIRIENLMIVIEIPAKKGARPMLGFEMLSFVPIDRRLIDLSLLTAQEITWLNQYHQKTLSHMTSCLTADDLRWVEGATKPL